MLFGLVGIPRLWRSQRSLSIGLGCFRTEGGPGHRRKTRNQRGLTLGIPSRQHQRRRRVYLQAPPALAGPRGGGGPGLAWPSGRCKSLACSSGYAETLARWLLQPPSPAAGEPPTLGLAWATVPIKRGATCGQGPAEASWESRRWPRSPQPNWKARLNFPGDKQKEKEGERLFHYV